MRVGLVVCALSAGFLLSACGGAAPSSLEFVDITPAEPRLGEISTVRFKAMDSRGQPMAGAEIAFRLQPKSDGSPPAGVIIAPMLVSTNKGDGMASVQITSSTRVSSVVVEAKSGDKLALSPALTFAGAVPNGKQFTFQCGSIAGAASGGIHAIGAYDDTRYLIAGVKLDCYAHVGDRNGDGVPKALVSFMTEAGTIGPTDTSVADVIGNAETLYKTSYPLPKDVAPGAFSWNTATAPDATHTGEYIAPLWMHPFLWVANPVLQYGTPPNLQEPRRQDPIRPGKTLNPRDNLVTMIAITTGEEGFDDLNNNGKYDNGEGWDDLTEPFVDSNDSGTLDDEERYVDTTGNGRWDGKNGTYDASTLIWAAERILWTGMPHWKDANGAEPVIRKLSPTSPPAIPHIEGVPVELLVTDPWFNGMAQNGGGDGCSTEVGSVVKATNGAASGVKFTYPSPTVIDFILQDAHDPTAQPPVPPFSPAVNFEVSINCVMTASPHEGHVTTLSVATITGTVL
ncbi:MAG: hypothetical protein ACYC8T_01550 [Myxococcaceae bacterium]